MHWDKDAEQGLPPQHHREPGSLRRDIVDELADHLACAAEREADAGHKEETIRTRVFDQFGDPAAIARSLWWDAMKETIIRNSAVIKGSHNQITARHTGHGIGSSRPPPS